MAENKYLNEKQYQQNVKKLNKIGKIVLIIGLCVFIVGFIFLVLGFSGIGKTSINSAEINNEQIATGIIGGFGFVMSAAFLVTFGLFITFIGGMILITAHRREIISFTTQQVIPVAEEGIEEIAPTIGNLSSKIAKGIKNGLNEDKNK